MAKNSGTNIAKNSMKVVGGIGLLVFGITMILVWWSDLAIVFRGLIGFFIALAGLCVLYSTKK